MRMKTMAICLIVLFVFLTACSQVENGPSNPTLMPTEEKANAINKLPVPSGAEKLTVELLKDLAESPVPENEKADYDAAYDQWNNGDSQKSIDQFNAFITKYPGSSLADDAQKMIGACYDNLGQYENALDAYAQVILKYPDSSSVASAYYNIAYIYNLRLKDPDKSIKYYVESLRHVRSSDSFVLGHSIEALKSISDIDVELGPDVDPSLAVTTFNPPTISLAEYNKIHVTATYDDVIKIIGGEGTKMSESGTGASRVASYSWKGEGRVGANAIIMFQNGKVISKAQSGLK